MKKQRFKDLSSVITMHEQQVFQETHSVPPPYDPQLDALRSGIVNSPAAEIPVLLAPIVGNRVQKFHEVARDVKPLKPVKSAIEVKPLLISLLHSAITSLTHTNQVSIHAFNDMMGTLRC